MVVIPLTDETKIVAIETTINELIAEGSRTFQSAYIARLCRKKGVQVSGYDVGRYFGCSDRFESIGNGQTGLRWAHVGEALA